MKKLFLGSLFIISLFFINLAFAENTYTRGTAGFSRGDLNGCAYGSCVEADTDIGQNFTFVPFGVTRDVGGGFWVGLEPELGYGKKEFSTNLKGVSVDGDVTTYSLMGNLLMGYNAKFIEPFIGAGIGVEHSKLDANLNFQRKCREYCGGGSQQLDSHEDFSRSWQFFGGAKVPIPVVPKVFFTAEAFYKKSDRQRFKQINYNANGDVGARFGLELRH